ncbi:hypothetical protein BDV98DRAFT_421982 [Pterulicium gracile]|uniref:Uncharacterized protein n=1 Tax=Pterulicium gracile TaxID=1884261 RepID=A0A5C3Q286_9AGAR|nr:hypothetical protein BDV98DRAFT_421982 [Pterula gracilis]
MSSPLTLIGLFCCIGSRFTAALLCSFCFLRLNSNVGSGNKRTKLNMRSRQNINENILISA